MNRKLVGTFKAYGSNRQIRLHLWLAIPSLEAFNFVCRKTTYVTNHCHPNHQLYKKIIKILLSYFETFLAMFLSPCMVSPVRDNWCSLKGVILEWSFVQELFPIQYARKMTWLCAFFGLGINILSSFLNSLRFVLKTTHKNKNLLGWLSLGYRHWNVQVKSSANPLLQTHYLRPVRWRLCVCRLSW